MFLKKRLLVLLTTAVLFTPSAHARDAADPERPIEISNFQGQQVAEILAQGCTENGWAAFSGWAKTSGFLTRSFADPVSVTTLKNGIKIPGHEIESTYENHKATLSVKGRAYKGEDACFAFVEYVNAEKSASRGWLSAFLPFALAAEEKPSDTASLTAADEAALAASLSCGELGGMDLLNKPPYTGSGLPLIEVAFYFGTVPNQRMDTKVDLEHVLTSDFSLKCSATAVSIQTATHKVLIRKVPSIAVTVFNRESNISDVVDKTSQFAKKSYDYVTQLAKSCNDAQTADDIRRAAEDQVEQARARVAVVSKAPAPSTAGGNPAAENAGPKSAVPAGVSQ